MPSTVKPPDLIITLSQDKVTLQLMEQQELGRTAWNTTLPIYGAFMEEQISNALDTALTQNPSLVDHFERVEVILVDRPNLCVPGFYRENGQLANIAEKYLRLRAGDFLVSDSTAQDTVIAYSFPSETLQVFREYYSNVGHLHLTSLLWSSLSSHHPVLSKDHSRLYFNLVGNSLIVLGATGEKLTFSRIFGIQDQGDFLYYTIACSRLLLPKETWYVTVRNEPSTFGVTSSPYASFDHKLELPELQTLIAHHRLCES